MAYTPGNVAAAGVLIVILIIVIIILACRSYQPLRLTQQPATPSPPSVQAGLWPYPNTITQGSDTLCVTVPKLSARPAFRQYRKELDAGCSSPLSDFDDYVQDLKCTNKKGTPLSFTVTMDTTFLLADRTSKTYATNESYTLTIDKTGAVNIQAPTYIGVGYAVTTLQQLLQPDGQGGCTISHLPVNIIRDAPRTYHRNVMLDTARNFFSASSICRVLQQMGAHKMNHFDWHISDDQSFPLNVGPITKIFSVTPSTDPNFKDMTGAFHPSKSYSQADITKIIGTARNYGIVVEPGIDTPGHCSSLMYGSKQASQKVLSKELQIVANWELVWQGMSNAPEPVIGYLDVSGDVIQVIHAIFQEVYDAFQMQSGRYGRRFNINADEVGTQIIPQQKYSAYLNELLTIFTTPAWKEVQISLWIDPVLSLNLSPLGSDYKYTDNLKLKQFDVDGRLTLGLWNLWPAVTVAQNNAVMDALPNSDCINYNSNYMYMDAGYPGQMWSGYNYDVGSNANVACQSLQTSFNMYWISALPTIGPQWGGYRGWPVAFGKIYTYNFHWDFTGTSPSSIVPSVAAGTGTARLHGVSGAGVAVWTETITQGTLDTKLVSNMAAVAEMTWKYDNSHAPDNLNHATYRLHHHLQQLQQAPYQVTSATPVYSGANLDRPFPQGCRMTIPITDSQQLITQQYLDKNYPAWKIQIRPEYQGMVCNDLLACINPEGPLGANAIALCPLSSRYVYGSMDPSTDPTKPANATITGRVNPWLLEEIGKLLHNGIGKNRIGRSNFASDSKLFKDSPFYTDQRDACIQLQAINNN
jgi:hypothetical protein